MAVTSTDVQFDREEQLRQIEPLVLDGERLLAVYDCKGAGTGFVGITDKRLIFLDKAFLRKSAAMTSIPFSRISSVSSVRESGVFRVTSSLVVKTGTDAFEFDFRGADKAPLAYQMIMRELLQAELA